MKITDHFSPNFEDRQYPVDMVILHYTDMVNAEAAMQRLCDPLAKVSAHYLISKTGEIIRLVPEDKIAYHAGISYWRGRSSLNQYSLGIELDNRGHLHGPEDFSEIQINSLLWLLSDIRSRHVIPNYNIIGHSDIAPSRKKDPGELFPWEKLADHGHGLWATLPNIFPLPDEIAFSPTTEDYLKAGGILKQIGYQVEPTSYMTSSIEYVLLAFQRHFLPLNVTGLLDAETIQRLHVVKDLY